MTHPRVVIAGAGFAGLTCARGLKNAPVDVLLVDRNNYHLFTPLLYQVASALLDPGEVARPVRELIRPLGNADFRLARVTGVDLERRALKTDRGELPYDYLVLATGSQSDYFGNASLAKHAMGLKQMEEGLALRNRVLSRVEATQWIGDRERRRNMLTFAIVGGGPTGVEMAGALSELIRHVLKKDYPHLDLGEVRVLLLEAEGSLLATFDPALREAARRSLQRKGVEVMLGARVADVTDQSIRLAGGEEISVGTVVWTAGVRGSEVGALLGVKLLRQARRPGGQALQHPGHPAVLGIGGLVRAVDGANPLPMLIPVAMQEGRRVAATIRGQGCQCGAAAVVFQESRTMATIRPQPRRGP